MSWACGRTQPLESPTATTRVGVGACAHLHRGGSRRSSDHGRCDYAWSVSESPTSPVSTSWGWTPRSRRSCGTSATRPPRRSRPRPSRRCSRASTSSGSPRPAPARPLRSRCRSSRASTCPRRRRRCWCSRPRASSRSQVSEAFGRYAAHLKGLHVLPVYGGQGYGVQLSALRRGVHVVVGTPGRVMDHLEKGTLDLSDCGSSYSTRPTRCSTWASPRTSRRSWPGRPRTSSWRCSARRSRRRSGGSSRSTRPVPPRSR